MQLDSLYGYCPKLLDTNFSDKVVYTNSAGPDQTVPKVIFQQRKKMQKKKKKKKRKKKRIK